MSFTALRAKAFTMVELIVVIVVLTILAGIAIVGYQKVVANTYDESARITVRSVLREAQAVASFRAGYTWEPSDLQTAIGDLPSSASPGLAASDYPGWQPEDGNSVCSGETLFQVAPDSTAVCLLAPSENVLGQPRKASWAISADSLYAAASVRSETGLAVFGRATTHGEVEFGSSSTSTPTTPPSGDYQISGRLLDSSGNGIEGCTVTAADSVGTSLSAVTDTNGDYVINAVPVGTFLVSAVNPPAGDGGPACPLAPYPFSPSFYGSPVVVAGGRQPNVMVPPSQSGIDIVAVPMSTPVRVPNLSDVTALSAADGFACAVRGTDGSVWCWGLGGSGQLGTGWNDPAFAPVQVKDAAGSGFLTGMVAVSAAGSHVCAVRGADGSVWCWGQGGAGQLGNGGTSDSTLPVQVSDPAGTGYLTGAFSVTAGTSTTCAVVYTMMIWNMDTGMDEPYVNPVVCWGSGLALGDGNSSSQHLTPTAVRKGPDSSPLDNVSMVTGSGYHHCAVDGTANLWCWGRDAEDQLGTGKFDTRPQPVLYDVPFPNTPFAPAVFASAGAQDTCGVLAGGSVWCWGQDGSGQLGSNHGGGSSSTPLQAAAGSMGAVDQVSVGTSHVCARTVANTVWCWGSNGSGQLGVNNAGADEPAPSVPVDATSMGAVSAVAVASDSTFSCALTSSDSTVWCWGEAVPSGATVAP